MHAWLLANIADPLTRTRYELARVDQLEEWWQMPLIVAACLVIVGYVAWLYRRDSIELKPGIGVVLGILRLAAFGGLLLAFLDVQKRTETKVVHNSRVVVLIDTSLSMSRADADQASPGAAPQRRIDQVIATLSDGDLLDRLRQTHDVIVAGFDAQLHRVATLAKLPRQGEDTQGSKGAPDEDEFAPLPEETIDWRQVLEPHGTETRLAQAVRQIINDERGSPISGVVVITDGSQNAGVDLAAAIQAAQEAKIPVHTVGLGSPNRPAGVRLSDLIAPARTYPNDGFQVTGYLQSHGLEGREVTIDLTILDAAQVTPDATAASPLVEDSQDVTLGSDTETVPVRFDIPAMRTVGKRLVQLRVKPLAEDADKSNNQQEAEIEVIDRKSRVLLLAGGPTRDYQFLRNMLHRSEMAKSGDMIVDVLLQSAAGGVSQDASTILDEFPRTMQELAEYDAIVAFDADWRELDEEQLNLLQRWVGDESGGLIVIAGPVYTDAWVQDPAMATVRNLYPVEFNRRLLLLEDARFGAEQPWPVEFTREGLEAEFLWLDDDAAVSQDVWGEFPGVFGFYRVRGAKPGATTYALFSDPEAAIGDQKPVYFAEHFYGAGRVFYMGSGEIWRLRSLDDRYFNAFYTKLIRHVSQGRLLRGSRLGTLLVERDRYLVGNTIVVKAQLSSRQHRPLEEPQVNLRVSRRDGSSSSVPMSADPLRKGMYSGQFTVTQEGECRLELIHPDEPDEVLSRRIQVLIPKLEQEHPERNDKLLADLAEGTGGATYLGMSQTVGDDNAPSLVDQLPDKTRENYVAGRKDRDFEQMWMRILLGMIAGCLTLEWFLRRLFKLA